MRAIISLVLFVASGCSIASAGAQRYKNLGNPTGYLFSAAASRVHEMIDHMEQKSIDGLEFVYRNTVTGGTEISVGPVYAVNYWTGKQETEKEAYPPEAGKIGEIEATFIVKISPQGTQTLVTIELERFVQQWGVIIL